MDEPRFYFDTDHMNRAGLTEIVRAQPEGDSDGASADGDECAMRETSLCMRQH